MSFKIKAQTPSYNMGQTPNKVGTCSGKFYDSGGGGNGYKENEKFVFTICPNNGGCAKVVFNSFSLGMTFNFPQIPVDTLFIYDGPDTNSVRIGFYQGSGSPGTITSSNRSGTGCLTFYFKSGPQTGINVTNRNGWDATISCNATCTDPPPPSDQDCKGAIPICQYVFNQTKSYTGSGSVDETGLMTGTCLATIKEINSVWYKFTAQTSGNLKFLLTPNGADDYDWGLFNMTGKTCDNVKPTDMVSCNTFYSQTSTGIDGGSADSQGPGSPAGQSQYNKDLPIVKGQTYYLLIENVSSSTNGYKLDFSKSTASIFDQVDPVLTAISTPVCGTNSLTATFSEKILCSTIDKGDFTVAGPGGTYTITDVKSVDCFNGELSSSTVTFTISPALQTVGTYTICLVNSSGSVTDACKNPAAPICFTFVPCVGPVVSVAPTSICKGNNATLTAVASSGKTPYTYTWASIGSTTSVITVSPATNTTYVVTVKDANGATASASALVTVNPLPTIQTNSPSVCPGSQAVLSASGASTYVWSGGPSTATYTVTPPPLTYTVTGTDSKGCTGTAVATITMNPLPTLTVNPPAICKDSAGVLTAGGATTYTWQPFNKTTPSITVTPVSLASITFTLSGTNSQGCTSSMVATIPVKDCSNPTVSVNNPTICIGTCTTLTANGLGGTAPLNYSWSTGASTSTLYLCPTATTSYTVTVTDAKGSTAEAVGVITVNPLPIVSASSTTICLNQTGILTASGATTYLWNTGDATATISKKPSVTTDYTVTGTDANGCSNTATTTITVNPLPTITGTDITLCSNTSGDLTVTGADSYIWQPGNQTGSTINVGPPITTTYTVTGTDLNGCTQTTNVTATVLSNLTALIKGPSSICDGTTVTLTGSGGSTYSWSTGEQTPTIVTTPSVTTTYTMTALAGTCSATTSFVITVNPIPTVTATGGTICSGGNVSIGATGANTYLWSTGQNTQNINVSPVKTTTYTVVGTSSGCSNSASSVVTVNPLPTVVASSATICQGFSTTLTSGGADTYSWSNGNSGSSVSLTPAITTTLVVTGTDLNGCKNTAMSTVIVNPIPTLTTTDKTICLGDPATLSMSGANTYLWMPGNLNGPVIKATLNTTTTYTVLGTSLYGCTQTRTVTIFVNPLPTIVLNTDTICQGETKVLTASGAVKYIWQPVNLTGSDAYLNPMSTTVYTVTGSDANGCSNSSTTEMVVKLTPIAGFDPQPRVVSIQEPVVHFINTTINGTTYEWDFGDDSTSTDVSVYHVFNDSKHYWVCLTAYNDGCKDKVCEEIIVEPEWTIYIPNAFTPNGDGLNDVFIPQGTNILTFEMWIFDRWGNPTYYCDSMSEPWIGSKDNVPGKSNIAQEDVYVYKVKIDDVFGKTHIYIGSVTLAK